MITFEKISVTMPWVASGYLGRSKQGSNGEIHPAMTTRLASGEDFSRVKQNQAVRWMPSFPTDMARALGVDPTCPPGEDDLFQLFGGRRADNGKAWTRVRRKTSAIDFIAQPHKSVTLAAEFAPTAAEAAAIWSCIDLANDSAMRRVAAVLGWARKGQGGRDGSDPGAAAWVSFRHHVTRPTLVLRYGEAGTRIAVEVPVQGDPHARIHNVLFNLVVTTDGRLGSLDTQRLTRAALLLCGAHFQAELARLFRELGIKVVCHPNGMAAVLSAVDSRAVELFSSRNGIIDQIAREYVERIELRWDSLHAETRYRFLRRAARLTRLGRRGDTPDRHYWRERAEMIGWEHASVLEGCVPPPVLGTEHVERAYSIAAHQVARHLAGGNVIDKDWLGVYAARALIGVGMSEPSDIDRVADLLAERFASAGKGLDPVTPCFRQRRRKQIPASRFSFTASDR